jgi:hypothetical protein
VGLSLTKKEASVMRVTNYYRLILLLAHVAELLDLYFLKKRI